jgi:hypothetical protein
MQSVHLILAHGGPTHQFLTDISGGYHLGGVDFSHITLRPSQPVVSTFHLRVPPDLQLKYIPPIKPKLSLRNLWPSRGLPTTRPSIETYTYT